MSEITIHCSHCGVELTIDEAYIGVDVECPVCHKNFTAQADTAPLAESSEDFENADASEKTVDVLEKIGGLSISAFQKTKNYAMEAKAHLDKKNQANKILSGDYEDVEEKRKLIRNWFGKIKAEKVRDNSVNAMIICLSELVECQILVIIAIINFFLRTSSAVNSKIVQIFNELQSIDFSYLDNLDILPRYGKKESQLVSSVQTLYSPAVDTSDGIVKYKYQLCGSGDDLKDYVYSLENITKIYTFADQLFVFSAVWDYTKGQLFNESTKAFFFKDISNISTKSNYEFVKIKKKKLKKARKPLKKNAMIGLAVVIIAILILVYCFPELIFGLVSMTALFYFIFLLRNKSVVEEKLVRKSETFTITASSGKSVAATILCDEWLEANKGVFNRRSNGEKVIQAIRKMVEEKKVTDA